MSHYLVERLETLAEHRRPHRAQALAARATATCEALRVRGPDGEATLEADACFVFIGASPRTDWLAGVVARDERGFILAGPDVPRERLAAQARPVRARDQRPRRVRGRRRARPLDQARRQRGGGGLDGGLAHPPVPRRHVSDRPRHRRRPAPGRPVRRPRRRRARAVGRGGELAHVRARRRSWPSRARRRPACSSCSRARSQTLVVHGGRSEPVGRQLAPTWICAIAVLTGDGPCRCACRPRRHAGWR